MNFLVLIPLIATAMAASIPSIPASIPVESYNTNHVPSLNQRFPVAADGRQSTDYEWLNIAMGQLLALPLSMTIEAINIKLQMIECAFNPDSCPLNPASYLAALTRDPNQKNNFGPYINTPLVAGQNEMPNVNRPYVGSYMPFLDSITRFNYPSFTNIAVQPAKGVVPASTVLAKTA